jgi:hypothetical protein
MIESIGYLGLVFIVIGWIISYKTIPDIKLSTFYGIGSLLLMIYSYLNNEQIFFILNGIAFILALINILRYLNHSIIE